MTPRGVLAIRYLCGAWCLIGFFVVIPNLVQYWPPNHHFTPAELELIRIRGEAMKYCYISMLVSAFCWLASFAESDRGAFLTLWWRNPDDTSHIITRDGVARQPIIRFWRRRRVIRIRAMAAIVALLLIAYFVWPTPYRYGIETSIRGVGMVYRTNRITGITEWDRSGSGDWVMNPN